MVLRPQPIENTIGCDQNQQADPNPKDPVPNRPFRREVADHLLSGSACFLDKGTLGGEALPDRGSLEVT